MKSLAVSYVPSTVRMALLFVVLGLGLARRVL